jgi:Flp pilus assembly protein TadG
MYKLNYNKLKKRQKKKAQALIELAMLLPFLLVLILGAIEFGRLFMAQTIITNAAREGAYYISIHPDDYDAGTGSAPNATIAAETEANNSGLSNISVTFTPKTCCANSGNSFEVTVNTDVPNVPILGLLGNIFSLTYVHNGVFTLSASVEMMVQ